MAILPGLVNAHAHLDFSGLQAPLGQRGIALADWIRLAMDYRRQAADSLPSSVAAGLRECAPLRSDHARRHRSTRNVAARAASPLDVTAFIELIAPTGRAGCRRSGTGKVASQCTRTLPRAGPADGVCRRHCARLESPRPVQRPSRVAWPP